MDVLQRAEWRLYKGLKRLRLKNRNATIFHPTAMANLFTMICVCRF